MAQHWIGSRIYRVDEWTVRDEDPLADDTGRGGAIFAMANGVAGLRGGLEEAPHEGPAAFWPALIVGGVYETEPIFYGERAFGFPMINQRTPVLANPVAMAFEIDGHRIGGITGRYQRHERLLDMRRGLLTRHFLWEASDGHRLEVNISRFFCFRDRHLLVHRIEIVVPDGGPVRVEAGLDARQPPASRTADPREGAAAMDDLLLLASGFNQGDLVLDQRLRYSSQRVMIRARQCLSAGECAKLAEHGIAGPMEAFTWTAAPGERLVIDRFIAVVDSRRVDEAHMAQTAADTLDRAEQAGFAKLAATQEQAVADFWASADVQIEGDPAVQQGLRFNLFHIFQSSGRDAVFPISAKGLTGNGYDGHAFWDAEVYVLPFLAHAAPDLARQLLQYRCRTLRYARARARELAHAKGALYPWRTVDGSECSAYFPAGTAQYHINAGIVFAMRRYWLATGDDAFMAESGVEIMIETARIWLDAGHFNPNRGGRFCIDEVTGPDEYTAMVSNNFYTNCMARMNLEQAVSGARWLQKYAPDKYRSLATRLGLTDAELAAFDEAAQAMYIPYHEALGIHPQDDGFLDKKPWDLSTVPPDRFPLLLHYHPLVIYRHKVCKQPDVLLALYLLSDCFTQEQKRRDFELYEPITTHDSTLSACVHSIIAAEIGEPEKAYRYFMETARIDLDDQHRNTVYGVHSAAMAGTWAGIVFGFGGFRIVAEAPTFRPQLPGPWRRYRFKLGWRGQRVAVQVDTDLVTYTLEVGDGLLIRHDGEAIHLQPNHPVSRPVVPLERFREEGAAA